MEHNHMSMDLRGKKIVSVTNGEIIGEVEDVLIDPEQRYVAALVTTSGNLFRRETNLIVREDIPIIGKHVILASRPDAIRSREAFANAERWVAVSDHLRGNDVVTNDGVRVGRLQDIVIDPNGKIIGYALSNVVVSGAVAESKQIPADSVVSFGKDVMIVDSSAIQMIAEPIDAEKREPGVLGGIFDPDPSTREEELHTPVEGELHQEHAADYREDVVTGQTRDTSRDFEGTVDDYPRDPDYPERPADEYRDEPVDDYPQGTARDFQKPRFDADDVERRRNDS